MTTRLWVLATTRAHCVESLSKTLNPHCSFPPRWKQKWVPANYHAGKVKQTRLCRRSSVPHNKKYIVESGLNAKEIEMGTTAESLELRFQRYLYLIYAYATMASRRVVSLCVQFLYFTWHTSIQSIVTMNIHELWMIKFYVVLISVLYCINHITTPNCTTPQCLLDVPMQKLMKGVLWLSKVKEPSSKPNQVRYLTLSA